MRMLKILIVAALFSAASAQAGQTFKIATLAPDGSSWMNEMRAAATEIEKHTEGRVAFRFYPGGVMGNDQSVLRKIRIGQLHGAAFTGGGLAEVYPDLLVYGQPFLFRSFEEVDYVRERIDPVLTKGLEEAGFVNFGFAEGGFARFLSLKPVRETSDLANEKAWVPEGDKLSYSVMKALGVSPVSLPMTDVMTGLQTGLISVVASSPIGAIAFQWHTRVNYMTDEPLAYLIGVFAIDKKAFNRIDAADQKVMREIMGATFKKLNAQNREDNAKAREALKKQGIEFVEASKGDLSGWRATAERVSRELAQNGQFSVELTNRVYEMLDTYRNGKGAKN